MTQNVSTNYRSSCKCTSRKLQTLCRRCLGLGVLVLHNIAPYKQSASCYKGIDKICNGFVCLLLLRGGLVSERSCAAKKLMQMSSKDFGPDAVSASLIPYAPSEQGLASYPTVA